jgi:L-lactate dehydrogenase (cytochrome)
MIGQDVAMPVALAPVGLTGCSHADGEIKAARAAEKFGVPFTLSTMSICSIEDVARNTSKPFWFQVYTLKDDDFMKRLFARAKDAKCSALVITVDLQILGQRHKDLKNGLSAPPKLTPASIANLPPRWGWGLEMLQTQRRFFGNIVGHAKGVSDPSSLASWTAEAFDPRSTGTGSRIPQMVGRAGDPEGHPRRRGREDGRQRGRRRDRGVEPWRAAARRRAQSIRMLPRILDAVGDKIEVHLDSGIRSGQDVLKALALGAKGTYDRARLRLRARRHGRGAG